MCYRQYMDERTIICRFCGNMSRTTDPRKLFCNKKCADRNRNRTSVRVTPVTGHTLTDLKGFGKLDTDLKRRVLLGEEQFSVVMFDIEATHLKPNVGRMLCCSFKPIGGEVYTFQALDRRFKNRDVYDDGALATAVRDELEKYDIIVGWNSKNFDVKFINSRCIHAGSRVKRAQYHIDGMWSWRTKLSAWSGLDNAQKFAIPSNARQKTSVVWEQWMRAIGWDPKLSKAAMTEIIEHCELDVGVLEDVYRIIVEADAVRSIRKDGGIL